MENKIKATKIIGLISFLIAMSTLLGAVISDIAIFGQFILSFLVAIIVFIFLFIIAFVLMILSCILVFGVYLLESQGFWPLSWASQAFHAIMNDATLTSDATQVLIILRIILLALCFVGFVLAIISLSMNKQIKKSQDSPPGKIKTNKGFALSGLILCIFGVITQIGIILIASIS